MQSKVGGGEAPVSLAKKLWDSNELKGLRDVGRGRAIIKAGSLDDLMTKTTITSGTVGSSTSGVLTIQRDPTVQGLAMRRLRLLDLVPRRRLNQSAVDFVKVSSATLLASPPERPTAWQVVVPAAPISLIAFPTAQVPETRRCK